MSRMTLILMSLTVISLLFVQLGASLDVERICERRCLYGRGGILCRCNAMHFTGKRSGGAHHTSAASRYRGDHLWKSGEVKVGINVAPLNDEDSSSVRSSSSAHGSPKSLDDSRNSLTSLASRTWDLDRVRRFFDSLRTLAHHSRFLEEAKETPKSKFQGNELFSRLQFNPLTAWANFPESQDGWYQEGDAELSQQPPESEQNFAGSQTFEYSNSLRDTISPLEIGNSQSRVHQEREDDDRDGSNGRSQDLAEDEGDTSSEQKAEIKRLEDVLRNALGGR